nr:DNA repair protein RadA [Serratia marcescens]
LDLNRVSLIMAVLEKRANLLLQNHDAYLKAAGGVKLDEPAIDLAIAVAIASSYQDKESPASDVFIGELGLTGEVRSVTDLEGRLKEARKLGFSRAVVPKNNLGGVNVPDGLKVIGVSTIKEALQLALG